MSQPFASGKYSIADCDVCGFRYKLTELKKLVVKTKITGAKACPQCWDPDHPQLQLGMVPVYDPQAVREPRPDSNLIASRNIEWGWSPLLGLKATSAVGLVSVTIT